jgi:hypothetical protein
MIQRLSQGCRDVAMKRRDVGYEGRDVAYCEGGAMNQYVSAAR